MCIEDIRLGRRTPAIVQSYKDYRTEDFVSTPPLIVRPNPNRVGLLLFGRQLIFGDNPELPTNSREGFITIYAQNNVPQPFDLSTALVEGNVIGQLAFPHPYLMLRVETHGQLVQWEMRLQPANWDIVSPTEVWSWANYVEFELREW